MGVAVVIAPFVAVFPPHAVWFLGSLAAGAFLAGRRWSERFTLVAVDGKCPKCEEQLDVRPGRLKVPHPLTCEACHHASTLRLPDTALEGHDPDTA